MENKDINNEIPRIFAVFKDLDGKYAQLIRSHHEVAKAKDKYNPQYTQEDRENTMKAIQILKKSAYRNR